MASRHRSTEAAVADAAAQSDVRAAAGARTPTGEPKCDAPRHGEGGPGSSDPLLAGLRKTGLLRLLVLHLLGAGPSYGNQLMERVGSLTGGLLAVNPNTMYPLLRALEAEGLVAGEWEHPERRSRRFYRLTEQRQRRARPAGGGRRAAPGRDRRRRRPDPARAGGLSPMGTVAARQPLPGASVARGRGPVAGPRPLARVRRRLRHARPPRGRLAAAPARGSSGTRCATAAAASSSRSPTSSRASPSSCASRTRSCAAPSACASARYDGGCEISLELDYALKQPGLGGRLTDVLFVRRSLGDALRRTLRRFAVELEADRAIQAEPERPRPRSRNEKES